MKPETAIEKYKHKEAFCLMRYVCRTCGFSEWMWNSRDGVTPYGVKCRNCPNGAEHHVNWRDDRRTGPDFVPPPGLRMFIDKTMETARQEAAARLRRVRQTTEPELATFRAMIPREGSMGWHARVDAIAKDIYRDGHQPHIIEAD